jgi:predicted nucleotidyltransferase
MDMPDSFLNSPLEYLFQAPSHIKILRALYPLKTGISGRELARRTGISDRNCRIVLNRLQTMGIVHSEGASVFHLFRLNTRHRLISLVLRPLFQSESCFKDELLRKIANSLKGRCRWSGIFGSVAKGADTVESDLDLLVITDTKSELSAISKRLDGLRSDLFEEWGVTLSPLTLTVGEWKSKKKVSPSLRRAILSNHIVLNGKGTHLP